jgi:hypothetical protein
MRFLSLRLKPKAAAAPRAGRGPGTGAVDEVKGVAWVHAVSSAMVTGSKKIQSIESVDIEVQSIIVFIDVSSIDFGSGFEPSPTYK